MKSNMELITRAPVPLTYKQQNVVTISSREQPYLYILYTLDNVIQEIDILQLTALVVNLLSKFCRKV